MRKTNEIEIKEDVKIGDIILEKGDKIRVLDEEVYEPAELNNPPIISKINFLFKKYVERDLAVIQDVQTGLSIVNKKWQLFVKTELSKIIVDHVNKRTDEDYSGIFVNSNNTWKIDDNFAKSSKKNQVVFPGNSDFVININFFDDADASQYSRKLKGYTNAPVDTGDFIDIAGEYYMDEESRNNIEIRGRLLLEIS